MRGPGTHMGVCEDGAFVGSLSGGCIENAVVAEALDALSAGAVRVVRFGNGSPYIDIKLPCGGGLDIHFLPLSDGKLVARCKSAIEARRPFSLELSRTASTAQFVDGWQQSRSEDEPGFATISHWPQPKLLIIGHGATVSALSRLAQPMGVTIEVLTPEMRLLDELASANVAVKRLSSPDDISAIHTDAWTAVVFLFHDHDWEIALMEHVLNRSHFYIGAMGGRRAHAFRTEALVERGVSSDAIATIHAPIGLFHSSRDPETLALSTLGEVIRTYHQHRFEDD